MQKQNVNYKHVLSELFTTQKAADGGPASSGFTVGDKVKLDIKAIRKQQNHPENQLPQYVEWINANSRKIFIVIKNQNGICHLARNDDEIPWTFWEGHLKTKG